MKIQFSCVPLVLSAALTVIALTACSSSSSPTPLDEQMSEEENSSNSENDTGDSNPDSTQFDAVYRVTFNATWSTDTHPVNFPDSPHFSSLVGAVHSEQAVFWQKGQIASPGIEQMAETGGTAILLSEIQSVIDEGRALATISGGGIGSSPGTVDLEVSVNRDFPYVSLVSMLAPSPDWFIGTNSLLTLDESGSFSPRLTVDLKLYDSGTDSGLQFDSINEDTEPPSPIELVTSISTDSVFVNGEPIVGTLLLEKVQ